MFTHFGLSWSFGEKKRFIFPQFTIIKIRLEIKIPQQVKIS
jgi:hypothetical protein